MFASASTKNIRLEPLQSSKKKENIPEIPEETLKHAPSKKNIRLEPLDLKGTLGKSTSMQSLLTFRREPKDVEEPKDPKEKFQFDNMLPKGMLASKNIMDFDLAEGSDGQAMVDACSLAETPLQKEGKQVWCPCIVLFQDEENRKYSVRIKGSRQVKEVNRLSLRFNCENKKVFENRVRSARERQQQAEEEIRFKLQVEAQDENVLAPLGRDIKSNVVNRLLDGCWEVDPDIHEDSLRQLLKEVS